MIYIIFFYFPLSPTTQLTLNRTTVILYNVIIGNILLPIGYWYSHDKDVYHIIQIAGIILIIPRDFQLSACLLGH